MKLAGSRRSSKNTLLHGIWITARSITCGFILSLLILVIIRHPELLFSYFDGTLDNHHIKVVEVRKGDSFTLIAESENCTEATISLNAQLDNMVSSVRLPMTVDTAGATKKVLVTLRPKNPGKSWSWKSHYDWKIGRRLKPGTGIPTFLYSLPFHNGPFKVIQAAHGTFSHYAGSGDEEAIDWGTPMGTKIYPARAGIVVAFRQDSTAGGSNPIYKQKGNFVVIRHDDGTFADYYHLKTNGVLVKLGDKVTPDNVIALSGNTGYSAGPHLHFTVYYTIDGKTRKTLPVLFKSSTGEAFKPEEGKSY